MSSKISIEIFSQNGGEDEIGFLIRSHDGSPLTAQEILDAVSEILLQEDGFFPQRPLNELDS